MIKEALYDEEVRLNIEKAATRARKAGALQRGVGGAGKEGAAEMRTAVEEFEQLLHEIRCDAEGIEREAGATDAHPRECDENDDAAAVTEDGEDVVASSQSGRVKRSQPTPTPKKGRGAPAAASKGKAAAGAAAGGKKANARGKSKKRCVDSSDEDDEASEDDEEEFEHESCAVENTVTRSARGGSTSRAGRSSARAEPQKVSKVQAASLRGSSSRGTQVAAAKRRAPLLEVTNEIEDDDDYDSDN